MVPESEVNPGVENDNDLSETENPNSEVFQKNGDSIPDETPLKEHGLVNPPFSDFDGPVPNDYFIPVDERSEPTDALVEPDFVPEYWWEKEPKYFYEDEYAYLNLLANAKAEDRSQSEAESESEVGPENEAESEDEAEHENKAEPEFKYIPTYDKGWEFGPKIVLIMNLVVPVCSCLGVTIFVLLYKCHRPYMEAKLRKLKILSVNDKEIAIWVMSTDLSVKMFSGKSENSEMTSHTRIEI